MSGGLYIFRMKKKSAGKEYINGKANLILYKTVTID
jgi:hypothetical protein